MATVTIYTTDHCPYCRMAKDLLSRRNVTFKEIRIDLDNSKRDEMVRLSHRHTVPQIFINEQPIGGYDDLAKLAKSDQLDKLLQTE